MAEIIKTSNQITFTEQKKIIEIKEWYLATNIDSGITSDNYTDYEWQETVQPISEEQKFLWNYEEIIYSIGESDISSPNVIGVYGTGVGIGQIQNFYAITTSMELPFDPDGDLPEDFWKTSVAEAGTLSPINKYLWNYEKITYTGTVMAPTVTEPAIIGVYGDSGEDAITFEAYSIDGFQFQKDVQTIKLMIAAFEGSEPIVEWDELHWEWKKVGEADDTYKELFNPVFHSPEPTEYRRGDCWTLSEGESYTDSEGNVYNTVGTKLVALVDSTDVEVAYNRRWGYGDDETFDPIIDDEGTLTVDINSEYALENLRCTMIYEGNVYIDYITLTSAVDFFTSYVQFLYGTNNILGTNDKYMIASVNIYKNNQELDALVTSVCYEDNLTIDENGFITTRISTTDIKDGDYVYFIDNSNNNYNVVLGQYISNRWVRVNESDVYEYIYKNTHNDSTSKVVLVKKSDIDMSMVIDFTVNSRYIDDTVNSQDIDNEEESVIDVEIAHASITVMDVNDPVISHEAPLNPKLGQLWLDTSVSPYILKIYSSKGWVQSSYQNGGSVYTLRPIEYNKDDLWVLADGESYNILSEDGQVVESFEFGNILKATVDYLPKTYHSKPNEYSVGDFWILAEGESYGSFAAGDKLMAMVDSTDTETPENERWTNDINTNLVDTCKDGESHWVDAMKPTTHIISNIKESFFWDDNGIKIQRRVESDDNVVTYPFYVHITSDRMGFHSVQYDEKGVVQDDTEVVHVGNKSARILNATLTGSYDAAGNIQDSTTVNHNVDFHGQINIFKGPYRVKGNNANPGEEWDSVDDAASGKQKTGFRLQIEDNDSLSLVIIE